MRFVCVSDTHNQLAVMDVPDGDVLLHAGDLTMQGTRDEVADAARALAALPHRHKVVIAGNHDFLFEQEPAIAREMMKGVTYLEDSEAAIGGVRIWGSPWQPWFCDWAFNLQRGADIKAKWDLIPAGIDILVTHGPPWGIADQVARGEKVGCEELGKAIERIAPRYHVFGHIHEGYGKVSAGRTTYVNASSCTPSYRATNPPIVIEVEPST